VSETELRGILEFLKNTERLKSVRRSAHTSTGDVESVAEHTWRLTLMASLLGSRVPGVDPLRLIRMCLIHDLGEAIGGDIPAPEQARLAREGNSEGKSANERRDLLEVLAPLPEGEREKIVELWDEYEAAETPTARLAKGLDKLETILQHTQGENPPEFDYRFNLRYGRRHTESPELLATLRRILDDETEARAIASESEGDR
jgi:putative hydrolases of HD superfamily